MSQERKIPAPPVLPDVAEYWQAADAGRLLVKRCGDCSEVHFYPRDVCPHCMSTNTEWLQSSGRGSIYSFSTMRRGDSAYTLAFVTLEEGVTMMTNLVDCDLDTLAIGQAVQVVFKPSEGGPAVPMFTPV